MVEVARRLTYGMASSHALVDKDYASDSISETKKVYDTPEEAMDGAQRGDMLHRVYRAALRKMKSFAKRENIGLLVHPRIMSMTPGVVKDGEGFKGSLTLRIEAEAYKPLN